MLYYFLTSVVNFFFFLYFVRSLRISNYSPSRCVKGREGCKCEIPCDSGIRIEDDTLVEILPHLFLGNAANSEDLETLTKHNIKVKLLVFAELLEMFWS